jgi:hypothetical protein
MRNQIPFLLLGILSGPAALPARAQVSSRSGALAGQVLDSQGAPVAAASLRLQNEATNQLRELQSGADGEFLAANLPAGFYTLRIQAPGFSEREYKELLVNAGQTVSLRISLLPASVIEKMEVTSEAPVLDTSAVAAATTFGYERMEHSPAQGRNYVNFVLSAPGIAPASGQSVGRSPAAVWNANNDSGFSAQGIRSRNNSISIDGTDNRDETTGAMRVSVPLEMVQELRIAGTTVSAELGGAAGGVVNVVTRSGSNVWHGHGEFLFMHDVFNARNPEFAIAGRPYLRRQQPGASASGPLSRDKTFFAGAFEIYRENCDEWSEGANPFPFRAGERNYQYSGKVQHLFNQVHSGSLRYAYSLGAVRNGVQGIENYSDFSARASSRVADHGLVGSFLSAFSPSFLNSVALQYGRRQADLSPNSRSPFIEIPGVLSFGQSWRADQDRTEQHLEIVNSSTWIRGRNSLNFGASVHQVYFHGRLANRFQSITLFPTLADYAANRPAFTIQAFGNPATHMQTTPTAFWINDRWQARRGLSLEAGLRYERQFMPAPFPASNLNFAPRFGLAWNPGGDSPWVFRLGTGLFFDRFPLSYLNEAVQKDGVQAWETYNGLPQRYVPSTDFPSTYAAKLTAGAERQIRQDTTLRWEYSHVRGLRLPRIRNWRATLPAEFLLEQTAVSRYDGITITLSRRMTSEFGYLLSYSGGRTYDDGSDFDEHPQDPLNLRAEWAKSKQHQAHRVTATGLFEYREFHLVPSFTFGSGRPVPFLALTDTFRTGAFPLSARAGASPRNPFLSPSNSSLDLRLFKLITQDDWKAKVQLGIDGYNLLNRSNPIRFIPYSGPSHLAPIEFSSARQLQLFVHLEF